MKNTGLKHGQYWLKINDKLFDQLEVVPDKNKKMVFKMAAQRQNTNTTITSLQTSASESCDFSERNESYTPFNKDVVILGGSIR